MLEAWGRLRTTPGEALQPLRALVGAAARVITYEAGAAGRTLRHRRMKPPGSEVAIETA
jgi:hypothetical protein